MTNDEAKVLFSKGFRSDDAGRAMDKMTIEKRMPHFKINKLKRGERGSQELANDIASIFTPKTKEA